MPIENRNLTPGTKLVARYHKQPYICEVVEGEDGKLRFQMEDGREFKSPSGAGAAVLGAGRTCNGWSFWSVATEAPTAPQVASLEEVLEYVAEAAEEEADGFDPDEPIVNLDAEQPDVAKKGLFRTPNQKGVPENQTRWFCSECKSSFLSSTDEMPTSCLQGHKVA